MASITQDVRDQYLSAVRKGQEIALTAVRTVTDTIQPFIATLPTVQLPLVDKLPKPEDAVASYYDMASKLLADQRAFAEEVVQATAALRPASTK